MTKRTVDELYEVYPNTKFFRLTNKDELHNGFQYKTGVNEDTVPFNPIGVCAKGGLYFYAEDQVHTYNKHVANAHYIREVTFDGLNDVQIYDEGDKLKANKFILGERELFVDALKLIKHTPDNVREFLNLNPQSIKYISDAYYLTYENIIACVTNKNNAGLQYVPTDMRTMSVCLSAVLNNGLSLEFVPDENHTFDMCKIACQNNGLALQFVKQNLFNDVQLNDLYLIAVCKNGLALKYVDIRLLTNEICLSAIKQNGEAIKILTDEQQHSPEVLQQLVKDNKTFIGFYDKKYLTEEICYEAVLRQGRNLYYVPVDKRTYKVCLAAVKSDGMVLELVPEEHKTYEVCYEAVKKNGLALCYVTNQCYELCDTALRSDINAFGFIKDQHEYFNKFVINKLFSRREKENVVLPYVKSVKNPTFNFYKELIECGFISVFEHLDIKDDDILIKLIDKDKNVFKYIKNPSNKVSEYAIKKDPSFLLFVNTDIDEDTIFNIVKQNRNLFKELKNQSFGLCKRFVEEYPNYLSDVKLNKEDPNYKEQMTELYKIIVSHKVSLYNIPEEFQTEEICLEAVKNCETDIVYIKDSNMRKLVRETLNLW